MYRKTRHAQFENSRIFTRFGDMNWPSMSLDLSVCYILGGFLKSRAYVTNPHALEQLKSNILDKLKEYHQTQ
jgi:hypothetical protein